MIKDMARLLSFLLLLIPVICPCGDGIRDAGEQCDNAGALGCTGCVVDTGYTCVGGDTTHRDTCFPTCGDGLKMPGEYCDDGNTVSGDGCDKYCRIEKGVSCYDGTTTTKDTCAPN